MSIGYPLVFAWQLDGDGGGRTLTWPVLRNAPLAALSSNYWLYLNRNSEAANQWLLQRSGLDHFVCKALLAPETRPRCLRHQEGIILYLRGVNLNEGADPHDMLAIRLWADHHGVVSLRGRRMFSPDDIQFDLEHNRGPKGPGDFLVALVGRLTERMEPTLDTLRDQLEELEHLTLAPRQPHEERRLGREIRQRLGRLRVAAVAMRRYIAPQREALARLAAEPLPWLSHEHHARLHELANETMRFVEDLDEIRDTAGIIQDQLTSAISEGMNGILYKLTLISAFFMPLSFVVGWLGSNVSGIVLNPDSPFFASEQGFALEGGLLLAIAVLQIALFRWLKWL